MSKIQVTEAQLERWREDGYVVVPRLFDEEEMHLLITIGKADQDMDKALTKRDAQGGVNRGRSNRRDRQKNCPNRANSFRRCKSQRIADATFYLRGIEPSEARILERGAD